MVSFGGGFNGNFLRGLNRPFSGILNRNPLTDRSTAPYGAIPEATTGLPSGRYSRPLRASGAQGSDHMGWPTRAYHRACRGLLGHQGREYPVCPKILPARRPGRAGIPYPPL